MLLCLVVAFRGAIMETIGSKYFKSYVPKLWSQEEKGAVQLAQVTVVVLSSTASHSTHLAPLRALPLSLHPVSPAAAGFRRWFGGEQACQALRSLTVPCLHRPGPAERDVARSTVRPCQFRIILYYCINPCICPCRSPSYLQQARQNEMSLKRKTMRETIRKSKKKNGFKKRKMILVNV